MFTYGSAANLGSTAAAGFNAFDPANATFATSDGPGYRVSSAAGAMYEFGDAPNDGSMAGTHLTAPSSPATATRPDPRPNPAR